MGYMRAGLMQSAHDSRHQDDLELCRVVCQHNCDTTQHLSVSGDKCLRMPGDGGISLSCRLTCQPVLCLQVRAHGASDSAYASYAAKLHVFYLLQCRQAAAYSLYAATTTFLPSVVVAVVLFYGGTLVLDGQVGSSCTHWAYSLLTVPHIIVIAVTLERDAAGL